MKIKREVKKRRNGRSVSEYRGTDEYFGEEKGKKIERESIHDTNEYLKTRIKGKKGES